METFKKKKKRLWVKIGYFKRTLLNGYWDAHDVLQLNVSKALNSRTRDLFYQCKLSAFFFPFFSCKKWKEKLTTTH